VTTETTAPPFAVVWSTDPIDSCQTRWKKNRHRARWHEWLRFETAKEASDAARANGLAQFVPAYANEHILSDKSGVAEPTIQPGDARPSTEADGGMEPQGQPQASIAQRPDYDVTCWQDDDGNVQWSEDRMP